MQNIFAWRDTWNLSIRLKLFFNACGSLHVCLIFYRYGSFNGIGWASRPWFLDFSTDCTYQYPFLDWSDYLFIFEGWGVGVVDPLFSRIRDHNFWIRRTEFGLGTNFHHDTSIFSFWRGGAWAWSILSFLRFGTTIFEFVAPNLILVLIFVANRTFFHFEGVGRGRGRCFVF